MVAGATGAEPTNWHSYFSGPVWELDETSGEYYLHLFSRKQPDLNWENPEVRQAVHAMLRWWLERGVDGFRMDVINMISKVLPLQDGPLLPYGRYGDGTGQFLHGPRLHEFLQELHAQVIAPSDKVLLTVAETPGVTVQQALDFTDPGRAEVDMVFQFEHVGLDQGAGGKWDVRPLRLVELKESLGRWQAVLGERGWNSLYWDNHDQPRAVSRFGSDDPAYRALSAKLLGTVLHLQRGTPYVYQGQELGMTNVPFASIEDFRDIESLNHYRQAVAAGEDPDRVLAALRAISRDNARTPMQWNDGPHAGFTSGTPWLPVNPNYVDINAAAQVTDAHSVYAHYRRLIALRHEHLVVAHGDFTLLAPDDPVVYAFLRRLGQVEWLVAANFSADTAGLELPEPDRWTGAELMLGNYPDPQPNGDRLDLRPWEAVVLNRTDR
jgi:oligo-1,6-glucosidase